MKKINNDRGSHLMRRSPFSHESKLTKLGTCIKAGMLFSLSLLSIRASAQVSVTASAGTTGPTVYTTLNSAFTAINAGTHQGTISIAITGNTTEPATPVPLLASGGTSNYTSINIKPSGGNFTINSNAAPVANRGIIELAGADNVTIDGDDPLTAGTQNLSIVAASVSTSGVACIRLSSNSSTGTDGANNNTVKNCIITGSRSSATSTTNNYGIQFSDGTSTSTSSTGAYSSLNTLIQGNIITRCYYGINAIGNSATYLNTGTQIKDNVIGNATSANNVGFRAILINNSATTAGTGSAIISGNDIRTGDYGTSGYSATIAGIELGDANAGCNINGNNIHDISQPSTSGYGAHGIYITSGTSNGSIRITNNFIRDCKMYVYQSSYTSQYIPCGVFFTGAATNLVFNHNTIVISPQLAVSTSYSSACVNASVSGVTFSQFLNNNLVNNHASSGAYVFYTAATGNISAAAVNNNNYYVNSAGKIGSYNGNIQTTLANWKTATSKDANSLNENPPFISATDLHLTQGAYTLLESGGAPTATTGVTVDYDNQARPGPSTYGYGTAPDIGADEFDGRGVACGTPAPGNTISSLGTTAVCSGVSVSLSLSTPPVGPGFTFQWQSSLNNTTFTDISGATNNTYTGPANANYYRCNVTCSIGPVSVASTPVQVLYNNNVTGTTPGARCGNGTVSLAATGSTGTTLRWYAAATGGTALATGSPFTTPVINTTTPYYVGAEAFSAGNVVVGTGTSATGINSYPNPLSAYYGGTKHQLLFLASELQALGLAPGNITSISFDVATINTSGICQDFTIRMGTTNVTALSGFVAGTVPVYNATFTPSATGIVTFNLSTPFNWNGTSNIILETVHNAGNSGNGNGTTTRYTTTPFNSVFSLAADNVTPATAAGFDASTSTNTTTSANRPNIVFGGQTLCSSPRVPVTATVNTPPTFTITPDQTICNNAITPLSVTSALGNFNTYTWSPVTNLYTDAAATVAYVAGSSAATVYFKSATPATTTYTVNANNTTTLCAAVATSAVTVLPAAVTAIATPSAMCISGITTLALVPATGYGASTFQWQSSTDNSLFGNVNGATSATYTTPVTTSNTYYRVVIKNSVGVTCLNSVSDTARVYNPAVSTTTPAARCGTGTVTLGATGVDGTLSWYAALTGGASLGTGTSFTTPSISATTTYYVASENSAQGIATLGAGASTSVSSTSSADRISPFDHYYGGFKTQNLITATELLAAGLRPGNIYSIAFDVATGGGTFQGFNMSIGTTTATALTTTPVGGLTPVFTSTAPAGITTPASGLVTVNFSTPFNWNGTANIVIETCWSNNNGGGTGTTVKYDATSYVSQNYYEADNQLPSAICGATSMIGTHSSRPKMVINGTALCASTPRTPVIATINPLPTIAVTPSGTVPVCTGSTTTLTATGGGNYQWRNASGNIGGQTNSTFTTGTAGTYKVVVTTPATGCTDSSAAITVNVVPAPTVFIGNDTTFCSGNTLTLNAGNTGATYLWNNGSTNQTRAVTATGTYSVKVTNSNNCSKSDTIQVTVNPTPVVNLGNDTTLCSGINYVLNSGNPGATRLWDNGTTAQTRTVTTNGTYYVRVTNSFNCTARDTVTTTFLPAPVVNLGSDRDICAGATVTLDAGNPGETYLWDNGTTSQTRSVNTTGNYYVTVSNTAVNCKGTDTVHVTVHPLPVVNLGNDTTFCHGNTLTLNAGNPGASYLWNDNSTGQTLNVTSTGSYGVVVTDAYACVGSDNINVLVKELPNGIINAVHGDTATYTFNVLNPQYVTTYTWNFGDGSPLVNGIMVQHKYAHNDIYTVSVLMRGECSDSTLKSRTVDVFDATGGTSIREIEDSKDLVLYPNPARDIVVIENKRNLKMKQITVYNIVGQVLSTAKADSEDKHKLHTQAFAAGIYTVRIETDKGVVIRKFEIMK